MLAIALPGCSIWSEWKPSDRYRELPSAEGQKVEMKYRSKSCAMCTSGNTSESAFFHQDKKYKEDDIGKKAEKLIYSAYKRDEIIYAGKSFADKDLYYIPLRIIVASIDPVVVFAIPWKHKAKIGTPLGLHYLFQECEEFSELKHHKDKFSYIPLFWPEKLAIPIEFRSTLPANTTEVRVLSNNFDKKMQIPAPPGGEIAIEMPPYSISLVRQPEGKVSVFLKTKNSISRSN